MLWTRAIKAEDMKLDDPKQHVEYEIHPLLIIDLTIYLFNYKLD